MYTGQMTQIDQWDNDLFRTCFLVEQLKNGALSLVLGAGVSVSFKLPQWNDLITNMEELMGVTCPSSYAGNLEKAEWLKNQCGDEAEYVENVRKALYKSRAAFSLESLSLLTTLNAITALSIPSRRGHISNILTFNFDNILEIYLRYYGLMVTCHANSNQYNESSDINIFHMHGYLPNDTNIEQSSNHIIFDKKSYDDLSDYTFWEWYPKVADLLRTNTCIFIGLSGEDENMDRFLKDTKKKHAYNESGDLFWGVSFVKDPDTVISQRWEDWGIYPIAISDFTEIPKQLFDIAQQASTFLVK